MHKFLEEKPTVMHKMVDYAIDMMYPEMAARTGVHYGTLHWRMNVLV